MLIRLEQKHIDEGERGECELCPVAQYWLEQGYKFVRVFPEESYVSKNGVADVVEHYEHGEILADQIQRFDNTGRMEPGEYEVTFVGD